ncbi:hypothetical protein [Devosia sp.]|uniref:hypothetical protein n=1 Tax=Devosia sp. TaxID=1871048 RepID=UPI002735B6C9|nr:hypothetical protein [Devosia sp.]MDP2779750.1 hypothetical protein [Devosia sp.]
MPKAETESQQVLSPAHVEVLVLALARARGEAGFTEAEGLIVVNWAKGVISEYGTLLSVLNGYTLVDVTPEGLLAFRLSSEGQAALDKLLKQKQPRRLFG